MPVLKEYVNGWPIRSCLRIIRNNKSKGARQQAKSAGMKNTKQVRPKSIAELGFYRQRDARSRLPEGWLCLLLT